MPDSASNNKRIAKNTVLLYIRTAFVMAVSLYTSRIILQVLGVDDYGIYSVVGGFVSIFGIISGALSNSIMRFITFELGHGDKDKLKSIFSTAINIQVFLAIVIIFLVETVGLWFLNYKMNISADRMHAANWVLHCTAITFAINLLNVPYNAVIIAHEKMSVYAYMSILEVSLKLCVVYFLFVSQWDKLVIFAILQMLVALTVRLIYGFYCTRHFEESRYKRTSDKPLLKEMFNFAGWNFFTNTAYMFNTQGVNVAINIFFNVSINAARGIATQVQGALMQFVDSFTTALNPQITKLYASGNIGKMNKLIIQGSKFSYLLALIICLPFLVETDYILNLWLVEVPPHTVAFVRLTIIGTIIDKFGNCIYTACMATGKIKKYVLWVTLVGFLVFPLTVIVYYLGAPVEATYYIFIIVYITVNAVRLGVMKKLLDFSIVDFLKRVFLPITIVTVFSVLLPISFVIVCPPSIMRFCLSIIISIVSASLFSFLIGLTATERRTVFTKMINSTKSKLFRL